MKKSNENGRSLSTGQRGPVDHERRIQIIESADEHFRIYGYDKTSVSDLGKAIGVSSAYIYRFFESKQAIGEAICSMTLGKIENALIEISSSSLSAPEKIRNVYRSIVEQGLELFFKERKLHDIVIAATQAQWKSIGRYREVKLEVIMKIIKDGREAGEFERKTPVDEVCRAILQTLEPFAHPILLQEKEVEEIHQNAASVANLVLRSLAP